MTANVTRAAMALALLFSMQGRGAEPPVPAGAPPLPCTTEGFASLGGYREANVSLPEARPRVVFIGDSITESWAQEDGFKAHPEFIGRGIGGQTTPQMLLRFYADVIALHPAVVHIMAGTNDLAENTGPETDEQIEAYIEAMAVLARTHGIQVILASIPPTQDFPWRPGLEPSPRIRRLNDWMRTYAGRKHLVYADYWHALATSGGAMNPELSPDGVHPNARGYQIMLPITQAAIGRLK